MSLSRAICCMRGDRTMTANHPAGHTLVGKPVHAPFLPITYTQRMNAGQIPWVAGFQKAPFDRFMWQTRLHQASAAAYKANNGLPHPQ